jgi:3'-phosphoadenosine 5'-phosphosulfate sulfotransferase (PAPS reductase)/FAD synthetase
MNASQGIDQLLPELDHRHLDGLEEEAIFILREVAASFERPALLLSGGKDSCVVLRLAEKAFKQRARVHDLRGHLPFPLLRGAFPISNWTELDVWLYIARENIPLPDMYYAHQREVVRRKGLLVPVTPVTPVQAGEQVEAVRVRLCTVGDMTSTCPVESLAADLVRHAQRWAQARIVEVTHRLDITTVAPITAHELAVNEIGEVVIGLQQPVPLQPCGTNRVGGALLVEEARA